MSVRLESDTTSLNSPLEYAFSRTGLEGRATFFFNPRYWPQGYIIVLLMLIQKVILFSIWFNNTVPDLNPPYLPLHSKSDTNHPKSIVDRVHQVSRIRILNLLVRNHVFPVISRREPNIGVPKPVQKRPHHHCKGTIHTANPWAVRLQGRNLRGCRPVILSQQLHLPFTFTQVIVIVKLLSYKLTAGFQFQQTHHKQMTECLSLSSTFLLTHQRSGWAG